LTPNLHQHNARVINEGGAIYQSLLALSGLRFAIAVTVPNG